MLELVRSESPATRSDRTSVLAGLVGVFIELYDNAVYGFLAGILAVVFFPAGEGGTALLLTFASFGIPFFFRPVGAAVAGSWGDRVGRRKVLLLLVCLMSVSTGLVGVLPSWSSAGVWAPVLLVLLRFAQGFAMGGEPGNGNSYLAEHAGPGRRGRVVAYANAATFVAMMTGTLFGALLTSTLSDSALYSWGWRLPFLVALPMGVLAVWIRSRAVESPEFARVEHEGSVPVNPLREVLASSAHRRAMLLCVVVPLFNSSGYFVLFTFMPTFLKGSAGFSATQGMLVTAASLAVGVPAVLVAGRLSDRFGRRPLLVTSAFTMVVVGWPCYWLFTRGSFGLAVLAAVVMAVVFAGTNGVVQVTLAELFPTRVRSVAYGVGYNLGTAVFGGGAPLLLSWLIGVTGSHWVPAFYLTVTCLVAGFAATRLRETAFSPLAD